MLLLLILSFILHTSAKLFLQNDKASDLDQAGSTDNGRVEYIIGDPLWVLQLNNDEWLDPKLRLGTLAEQEDFYYVVGPMMKDFRTQQPSSKQNNDTAQAKKAPQAAENNNNPLNINLKKDIMKIINKFTLSTSLEPDSYLTDSTDAYTPSIALYFKGPVTCLLVKLGIKQWHYVINPSPFPAWFYKRHDTFEAPLKIPNDVQTTFFAKLLRLLKVILYHPL